MCVPCVRFSTEFSYNHCTDIICCVLDILQSFTTISTYIKIRDGELLLAFEVVMFEFSHVSELQTF